MVTLALRAAAASVLLLAGDVQQQHYYKTKDEAVQHVPPHVTPKECWVWKDGKAPTPWRVIPGTGCAHWVAHQKGIHRGAKCLDGCSIRVRDVVHGLARFELTDAKLDDIWATANLSHCGIVVGLKKDKASKTVAVKVRNCSSAKGKVVTSVCSSGNVYRLKPSGETP